MMRRRDFITLLGGAAAAWPIAARAQQPAMLTIAWLRAGAPPRTENVSGFWRGLNEAGFVEGRNLTIELRNSEQYDRLARLASDLVRIHISAIFADTLPAAVAARAATATIPIVFAIGGDPIRDGLVTSLSRPTANLTGLTFFSGELLPKRLELLRELVPAAKLIAILLNPSNLNLQTRMRDIQEAAGAVGQQVLLINAASENDIDKAFATIVRERAEALLVGDDPYFNSLNGRIIALAARHALPTSYNGSGAVRQGGLMSYGDDRPESFRQAGRYVGRILNGDVPPDLPVLQPTKFEFAINIKTAKVLGLKIPESFLLRADVVVE